MWFKQLTGFEEVSPEDVRANLKVEGDTFVSKSSNKRFTFGKLETPTLLELKEQSNSLEAYKDKIRVKEVVANVQELHQQIENEHALFQATS